MIYQDHELVSLLVVGTECRDCRGTVPLFLFNGKIKYQYYSMRNIKLSPIQWQVIVIMHGYTKYEFLSDSCIHIEMKILSQGAHFRRRGYFSPERPVLKNKKLIENEALNSRIFRRQFYSRKMNQIKVTSLSCPAAR